jgi:hypothetical protein
MTRFVIVFSRQFLPCQQGLVWQERSLPGNSPLLHIYEQLCSSNSRLPLGGNFNFVFREIFEVLTPRNYLPRKQFQNGIKWQSNSQKIHAKLLKRNYPVLKQLAIHYSYFSIKKISRCTNFAKFFKIVRIVRYFWQFCQMLKIVQFFPRNFVKWDLAERLERWQPMP